MVFTIEEVENYLKQCKNLDEAIKNLSEQSIIDNIKPDDFNSLNYIRNQENLFKYEISIGMKNRKIEQKALYINTKGEKGRYWLACSPRWIEENELKRDTEYKIAYWINYGDNSTYGWFTVEEVQQWFDYHDILLYQIGGTKEFQIDY